MSALENDNKRKEINNKPIKPLTLTSDWHITSPHNFCRAFSTWAIRLRRLGNHPLHYRHKINCTVLFCFVLYCIVLCCVVLCCVVLCCVVLCCVVLCCVVLCCVVLCCVVLCCVVLCCIVLYCNIHIYSANRKWDIQILITNLWGNVQQLEERINNQISGVPRLSKTDS